MDEMITMEGENIDKQMNFEEILGETLNYSNNTWKYNLSYPYIYLCRSIAHVEAHNGTVYSVVSHENMLYSSSNKTFKVWSLDTMTCISEVNAHLSFVKTMTVWPER